MQNNLKYHTLLVKTILIKYIQTIILIEIIMQQYKTQKAFDLNKMPKTVGEAVKSISAHTTHIYKSTK